MPVTTRDDLADQTITEVQDQIVQTALKKRRQRKPRAVRPLKPAQPLEPKEASMGPPSTGKMLSGTTYGAAALRGMSTSSVPTVRIDNASGVSTKRIRKAPMHKVEKASAAPNMLGIQSYLPTEARRDLTSEEEAQIARESSHWLPRIFRGYGTPYAETMSSPTKGALIGPMLGALLGGGVGALASGQTGNARIGAGATGAGLGALGGLPLGLLMYFQRKAKNEEVREMMRRLPENPVLRDLYADPVMQADLDRKSRMFEPAARGANTAALAAMLAKRGSANPKYAPQGPSGRIFMPFPAGRPALFKKVGSALVKQAIAVPKWISKVPKWFSQGSKSTARAAQEGRAIANATREGEGLANVAREGKALTNVGRDLKTLESGAANFTGRAPLNRPTWPVNAQPTITTKGVRIGPRAAAASDTAVMQSGAAANATLAGGQAAAQAAPAAKSLFRKYPRTSVALGGAGSLAGLVYGSQLLGAPVETPRRVVGWFRGGNPNMPYSEYDQLMADPVDWSRVDDLTKRRLAVQLNQTMADKKIGNEWDWRAYANDHAKEALDPARKHDFALKFRTTILPRIDELKPIMTAAKDPKNPSYGNYQRVLNGVVPAWRQEVLDTMAAEQGQVTPETLTAVELLLHNLPDPATSANYGTATAERILAGYPLGPNNVGNLPAEKALQAQWQRFREQIESMRAARAEQEYLLRYALSDAYATKLPAWKYVNPEGK